MRRTMFAVTAALALLGGCASRQPAPTMLPRPSQEAIAEVQRLAAIEMAKIPQALHAPRAFPTDEAPGALKLNFKLERPPTPEVYNAERNAPVPATLTDAVFVAAPVVGPDGWTVFTASPDTRKVYVSSSTGNDTNTGLDEAHPKKSIGGGYGLMRSGMPDWLLLKSGDTWNETFPSWNKVGRSANEVMRIALYAGTDRAIINCGTSRGFEAGAFTAGQVNAYLAVTDCAFISQQNGTNTTSAGVQFLGSWSNVLLENLSVERFGTNVVFQSDRTTQTMRNITVRRCVIRDSFTAQNFHSQGTYLAGIDQLLLEEDVFDHNGWNESVPGATPTIFRHNIYIQGHAGDFNDCTNVTTRGLISGRAAATGMQQRPGGLCENSLFLDSPLNLVFGTEGGLIQWCVVHMSHDLDGSNPRSVGFNLVNSTTGARTDVKGCIASGPIRGTENWYAYAADQCQDVRIDGSVCSNWKTAAGQGKAVNASNCPMPTVTNSNMEQSAPLGGQPTIAFFMASKGYASSLQNVAGYMSVAVTFSRTNTHLYAAMGAKVVGDAFRKMFPATFPTTPPPPCYANCDGSTVAPIVNQADFTCFLNRFAAGDPYANCDGSTQAPVLNVADFTCFVTKVAAGCPGSSN